MPKIFATLDKIRPAYDITYKVVMVICKLLLVADILITSYAVCGRLFGGIELPSGKMLREVIPFLRDPAWTEQVVLTLMSYMAVLSAALAIRDHAHIGMTAFDRYLPKNAIIALDLLADVGVLALGMIMLVVGWDYAVTLGARGFYESMPSVSRFWMYLPVPLAGLAMIVFQIESLYETIKSIFVKEEVA